MRAGGGLPHEIDRFHCEPEALAPVVAGADEAQHFVLRAEAEAVPHRIAVEGADADVEPRFIVAVCERLDFYGRPCACADFGCDGIGDSERNAERRAPPLESLHKHADQRERVARHIAPIRKPYAKLRPCPHAMHEMDGGDIGSEVGAAGGVDDRRRAGFAVLEMGIDPEDGSFGFAHHQA